MADAPVVPHLYLLGGIELQGIGQPSADRLLAQSKLAALCALLALAPEGRLQRRDRLVGMLWPELDQSHARAALRKALHALRGALGEEALRTRGDDEVAFEPGAIWCDAVELATAIDKGHLAHAVKLYRGELMPGFHLPDCAEFDHWLEEERTEARERAASAAWALAKRMESDEKLTDAGSWARKAARFALDDERVLRRTISLLARIGDHAGALKLYDEFAARMKADLDASPSPETIALVDGLRK